MTQHKTADRLCEILHEINTELFANEDVRLTLIVRTPGVDEDDILLSDDKLTEVAGVVNRAIDRETEELKVDAQLFNFWVTAASYIPADTAKAIMNCTTPDEYRKALMALAKLTEQHEHEHEHP